MKVVFYNILFCLIIMNFGCSNMPDKLKGLVKTELIDHDVYSRYISSSTLSETTFFYGDEVTLSFKKAVLVDGLWSSQYIDRVDVVERLNPILGKSFNFQDNEKTVVLYQDYQSEKKTLFKYLNILNEEYTIDTLDIQCTDFSLINTDPKIIIYLDDVLAAKKMINGELVDIILNAEISQKIIDFKTFQLDDYITIVYRDIDDALYLLRLSLVDNLVGLAPFKIAESINSYSATLIGNEVVIAFSDKSGCVNLYQAGEYKKVGYYSNPYRIELGSIPSSLLLFIADSENIAEGTENNSLYIAYQYPPKYISWKEEKIISSEIPFAGMHVIIDDTNVKLALSDLNLNLYTIPVEAFKK